MERKLEDMSDSELEQLAAAIKQTMSNRAIMKERLGITTRVYKHGWTVAPRNIDIAHRAPTATASPVYDAVVQDPYRKDVNQWLQVLGLFTPDWAHDTISSAAHVNLDSFIEQCALEDCTPLQQEGWNQPWRGTATVRLYLYTPPFMCCAASFQKEFSFIEILGWGWRYAKIQGDAIWTRDSPYAEWQVLMSLDAFVKEVDAGDSVPFAIKHGSTDSHHLKTNQSESPHKECGDKGDECGSKQRRSLA
jgi:hypothetical protein